MKIKSNGKKLGLKSTQMLVPEGDYLATIKEVVPELDVETKYGKQDRVKIMYELKSESGAHALTKSDVIWYNEMANSRWNVFLHELYGKEIPDEVEIQDWVGLDCWIRIEHQEDKDKNTYANVTEWSFDFEDETDNGDEIPFDEEELDE